ncbi:hypothetical protein EJ06DRAFT_549402 [Trichodelitschia bisporula]|uniref:Uncharacterized protein n=1 Tax=Trichodelitschia bisporula TaxID=703511 RepID=A0A6G1HVR4_9PEZI|nr:hypothetical protein EJ06DRAFT_549402 [Trichodelitschia bisporula]
MSVTTPAHGIWRSLGCLPIFLCPLPRGVLQSATYTPVTRQFSASGIVTGRSKALSIPLWPSYVAEASCPVKCCEARAWEIQLLPPPQGADDGSEQLSVESLDPQSARLPIRKVLVGEIIIPSRKQMKLRPSPSIHLSEALNETGNHAVHPPAREHSKLDLSMPHRWQRGGPASPHSSSKQETWSGRSRISLQSITAKAIRVTPVPSMSKNLQVQEELDLVESDAFLGSGNPVAVDEGLYTTEELGYLGRKGYTLEDVRLWASILSHRDSVAAAQFLLELICPPHASGLRTPDVPHWVFTFFLRRKDISRKALRILLSVASQYPFPRTLTTTDRFIIVVRLVRHALRVWPEALPQIASWLTTRVLPLQEASGLSPDHLARWTFLHNRALRLFSRPTKLRPMIASSLQQRAQFDIIRKMLEHNPPLVLAEEGYRAVSTVLLRLKKMPQERDWAGLKAKSWPPFKQSRTRLDDEKDPEYGASLAMQSLRHMVEAGYPPDVTEASIKILAGWNVDGSPTIQHRAVISMPSVAPTYASLKRSRSKRLPVTAESTPKSHTPTETGAAIWAVKIQATRTLHEAWACFLQYESLGLPSEPSVFYAMLIKLIYEHIRRVRTTKRPGRSTQSTRRDLSAPLPGDGRELYAPPESPVEAMHLRTSPPSTESFWARIQAEKIHFTPRQLGFLTSIAPRPDLGLSFWAAARPSGDFTISHSSPPRLLTPLITLLTRYPSLDAPVFLSEPHPALPRGPSTAPLLQALRLAFTFNPPDTRTWTALLSALGKPAAFHPFVDPEAYAKGVGYITALDLAGSVVAHMQRQGFALEETGFAALCKVVENAARAARALLGSEDVELRDRAGRVLGEVPAFLEGAFTALVGEEKEGLPGLLTVPEPKTLHVYVRALGMAGLIQPHLRLKDT